MQVFLLESKCYPVNSYTFQQMLECYLWLATAQPMALNHSFVIFGGVFVYLFVLICSHFCDSQFLFSVVNHTTVWIFMKLSHSFRPEYWHILSFCHKVEQQVLFPS